MKTLKYFLSFIFISISVYAQTSPKKLLIYYNWPSQLGNSNTAATIFSAYDYLVLGDGLQKTIHGDHFSTKSILAQPQMASVKVFGYIDLGVTTQNLSITEIQNRMNEWKEMGSNVNGVLLDDFGYDYEVSRVRQNAAVNYAHSIGLSVIANGWNPDEVFGNIYQSTYNPSQIPTTLNSSDFYLSESYLIMNGDYHNTSNWKNKADKVHTYQNIFGFKILSVTTNTNTSYSESKFHYAWYGAAIYNHEAIGWGEQYFGASQAYSTFRNRPTQIPSGNFNGGILNTGSEYYRNTTTGKIFININTRSYGFTTFSSTCVSKVVVGNWSDSNSWDCGYIPTVFTDVIIKSGHKITSDIDAVCRKLTVERGAVFTGIPVLTAKP